MDQILKFLEPFTHLDPAGWVAVQRQIPIWAAVLMCGAGLFLAFKGSGRAFRFALAPVAAIAGLLGGPLLAGLAHLKPDFAQLGGMAVLGLGALIYPPLILFCAVGIGGALLGAEAAGPQDYWLGFIPGFLVAGALSFLMDRFLRVLISALVAAVLLTLGAIAIATYTQFGALVAGNPIVCLTFTGFVTLGSMAFQFTVTPRDDVGAQKANLEKQKKKALEKEDRERMERFEAQGKPQKASKRRS